MTLVPRIANPEGCARTWTNASYRPGVTSPSPGPSHGTIGYNEAVQSIEVYDALNGNGASGPGWLSAPATNVGLPAISTANAGKTNGANGASANTANTNGGLGTTNYTMTDIVHALKLLGILAQ